jgi:hypothetical protein
MFGSAGMQSRSSQSTRFFFLSTLEWAILVIIPFAGRWPNSADLARFNLPM